MDLSWLQSLLLGLLSGFAELVPVSSQAHEGILLRLFGAGSATPAFELFIHIAVLLALLTGLWNSLNRLRREQRIARIPRKRRSRQPDRKLLMDMRLLKTAVLPMLVVMILRIRFGERKMDAVWLSVFLILNGILLYIPQHLPAGNKDSRMLSRLDGVGMGVAAGLGALPGVSGVGASISFLSARGADRQYAADITLLLCIPVMIISLALDAYAVVLTGFGGLSGGLLFKYVLAAAAAYIGAYSGIVLTRFLAVKIGYTGFAYYSWGLALFAFILYMI